MTSATKTFNIAGGLIGNVIIPNDQLRNKFSRANMATGETPNRFGMIMGEKAMKEGQKCLKYSRLVCWGKSTTLCGFYRYGNLWGFWNE